MADELAETACQNRATAGETRAMKPTLPGPLFTAGIIAGLALGVAFGLSFGNVAFGMPVGAMLGILIGAMLNRAGDDQQ